MLDSDSRRVEQILLNLLNNAIKFTPKGKVELEAAIISKDAMKELRLCVSDSGIGIKPEDMGKLFEPFVQIDSGLTRQYEGTGLGLVICRKLAKLLRGDVQAQSQWGKGSVFTLSLPL